MEEHFNVAFSPLVLHQWLYNWFFFPSPPVAPATAVITIYLGSLFHYSRAAEKPEEKCCVLWFMEAIWPVLIRGIYECDAGVGNGLWALLGDGIENTAFEGKDGTGVSADWKTNMSRCEQPNAEYRLRSHVSLKPLPREFNLKVMEENLCFNPSYCHF